MKTIYQYSSILIAVHMFCAAAAENLTFVPESGTRVDVAAVPEAGIDSTGKTYLYYVEGFVGGKDRVSISTDGLNFPAGMSYTTYANDSRNTRLPDGSYRRYVAPMPGTAFFTSQTSADGVSFSPQPAAVYTLNAADNGSSGVYDAYAQTNGNVVLLYLGDLHGLNNARMARSTDGGKTFTFVRGNVLGDDLAGGGSNSYVDITSLRLPDGRRRLFAMKGGVAIYSFISSDDGDTYTQEPGARVSRTDFKEYTVTGLFDPVVVPLGDGSYRMYVCANVLNADGSTTSKIVSALASAAGGPAITSPASAIPALARLGEEVVFSASASGGALNYTWSFGDGGTATGASVKHAFLAIGNYTAICTVSDASGGISSSQVSVTISAGSGGDKSDSDGDGFTNAIEVLNGSDPNSAASTPFNLPAAQNVDGALKLSRLSIRFNFGRKASDSILLSGTAVLPSGFSPNQQRVFVDIGGIVRTFVLDAKGNGASGGDLMSVRTRKNSPAAILSIKLAQSTYLADFADEGLTNADVRSQSATVGVAMVIGTNAFQTDTAVTYVARKDKSGLAKK
jgi:hypothetical protein